ncbi:MAG: SPASM domain-containing protein, partial [Actinobacteria bacterium]|nr:SPASM domain-containing protein [Actinomycetota bacterium]
ISSANRDCIVPAVDFIGELGLEAFAMNGIIYTGGAKDSGAGVPESEMAGILFEVQERAIQKGMNFIWYTPTRYCDLDPVGLGLGPKQCTAAKYNMCIEPNGDVIPCQSYFKPAGNVLHDEWNSIWNAPVCLAIRDREFVDDECRDCETFSICGGGCPLAREKGVVACFESRSTN